MPTYLYWIAFCVAGAAFVVIGVIVMRHWKEIRLLNPDSIQEERERQKRDELMLKRFERVRHEKFAPLAAIFSRVMTVGKTAYHALYIRLVTLEKFYRQAKTPFAFMSPTIKDRIKLLLNDARALTRDTKYADAERRYLEAITIDPRCWDAYRGLGTIYLKQKMYPQARETFEFLLQKKADDVVYASLAEIIEAEGDEKRAETLRGQAVEFRPRLPQRHAEMAEFYLAHGQAEKAWPFAKHAKEMDEKSIKYLEVSLETAILLGDRNEARRDYDKLRLLTDDRVKIQGFKARIDKMVM